MNELRIMWWDGSTLRTATRGEDGFWTNQNSYWDVLPEKVIELLHAGYQEITPRMAYYLYLPSDWMPSY